MKDTDEDTGGPATAHGRVWHPWVRVARLIFALRSTCWDAATWPAAKATPSGWRKP